ncbi:MAG: hypothetical protein QXL14_02410 [Candidatus Aenigmatarchaeota archaeon]
MDTKLAIKIGLIAGLVSAFYPSIPTIIQFEYYKKPWFIIYIALTLIALLLIYKMVD